MLRPYYFMHHVMRIPYVLVVYGVDAWRMSRFSRQIVAHSRRLASISEFTTKRVKAQLASAFPISYLPPTVDANRFQPGSPTVDVRAMHDLSANDCVVLCVCRFAASEQYKGYDCLLRAWPSVLKRIKNARLLFVGKGNDLLRAKKLADAEGLNETVRFAGFVEADLLPDYYRACDVFAMPSVGEGFGIVFLEALACGKPVIAGDKDGSADPLLKGELGILINPLSVDELTEALIKAMTGDGPKHLYDSLWLRNHVIAAYGPQIFKERMRLFIDQSMEP